MIVLNTKDLIVTPLNRAFPSKRKRKKPWNATPHEESFLESCRRRVEEQYAHARLGSGQVGGCFGSILCHELHSGGPVIGTLPPTKKGGKKYDVHIGLHFSALAEKWGIPVSLLGELVWDHCKRLESQLQVNHGYKA